MRIEICGGIGSGKSTLAKLMSENGYRCILENFKANPFWKPFYSNPTKYNFETEITFLLQHYHEIKIAKENSIRFACDFSFYQDMAYAKMGLQGKRLRIFENIFTEVLKEVGQPDLIICLVCDIETLLKRIKARGLKEESAIDFEFLAELNKDIYLVAEKIENNIEVLFIDSGQLDFASNARDQNIVLKLINSKVIKNIL